MRQSLFGGHFSGYRACSSTCADTTPRTRSTLPRVWSSCVLACPCSPWTSLLAVCPMNVFDPPNCYVPMGIDAGHCTLLVPCVVYYDSCFAGRRSSSVAACRSPVEFFIECLQMQHQPERNDLVYLTPTNAKTMFGVAADAWCLVTWSSGGARCTHRWCAEGTADASCGRSGGPIPAEQGGGAWIANDMYTAIFSVWGWRSCKVRRAPMSPVSSVHKIAITCAGPSVMS